MRKDKESLQKGKYLQKKILIDVQMNVWKCMRKKKMGYKKGKY